MTTRPTHVGTIGDKIRIGHSLTINCGNRECLHRAKLDLEDIAARFGANLPVADLVPGLSALSVAHDGLGYRSRCRSTTRRAWCRTGGRNDVAGLLPRLRATSGAGERSGGRRAILDMGDSLASRQMPAYGEV
jgi:hypothetical protein